MAQFSSGDKFGVTAANALLKETGRGGSEGEIAVNPVNGVYTLQRHNGSTWENVSAIAGGNDDQFLRGDTSLGHIWKCPSQYYSGEVEVDDNNPATVMIKIPSAAPVVLLKIIGNTFPTWHYTELAWHGHPTTTFASNLHIHVNPAGNTDDEEVTPPSSYIHYQTSGGGASHGHPIPSTNTASPSAVASVASYGTTVNEILNTSKKTTLDTNITIGFSSDNSSWVTKSKNDFGFGTIANINSGMGTDELDITGLVNAPGYWLIKFSEPTAHKGGRILWHLTILG